MSNKLIQIEVAKLYPHPKNPRLDVGDVTELAESIKAKGILQNLTVVPGGPGVPDGVDGFTVIIGHRRRAGAIEAGIETVPCAVVEMDEKEQVSTMLLENMQRNDLTIYEQAQGIQMMLDLGDTVKDISEKTGFSLSTIDRRRKLLNLDKDKFCETQSKNATLEDYLKVSEIEDEKERNIVLGFIGTNNFEYQLKTALANQRKKNLKEKIMAVMPEDAIIATSYNDLPVYSEREEVETIYYHNNLSDERINEIKKELSEIVKPYVYYNGYCIGIYKKVAPKTEKVDEEADKKIQAEAERREKLNELNKTCTALRNEFLKSFTPSKQNLEKVIKFNAITRKFDGWNEYEPEDLCKYLGVEYENEDEDEADYDYDILKLQECIEISPIKTLYYQAALSIIGENLTAHQHWNGEYLGDKDLDVVYEGLKILGYQMSDDEQKYIDGTHELYAQEQEDD